MRTTEDMAVYVNSHQFAFNALAEESDFKPIERILEKDEEFFTGWTVSGAYKGIYTTDFVFEGAAAFALTNNRLIATDGEKTLSIPIEQLNGIYITMSDTDFDDEMLLAAEHNIIVFFSQEINSHRLKNVVNRYLEMLMIGVVGEPIDLKRHGLPKEYF